MWRYINCGCRNCTLCVVTGGRTCRHWDSMFVWFTPVYTWVYGGFEYSVRVCVCARNSLMLSSIPMAFGSNSAAASLLLCGSCMKYAWHEPPPKTLVEMRGGSTPVRSEGALEEGLSQWIKQEHGRSLHKEDHGKPSLRKRSLNPSGLYPPSEPGTAH